MASTNDNTTSTSSPNDPMYHYPGEPTTRMPPYLAVPNRTSSTRAAATMATMTRGVLFCSQHRDAPWYGDCPCYHGQRVPMIPGMMDMVDDVLSGRIFRGRRSHVGVDTASAPAQAPAPAVPGRRRRPATADTAISVSTPPPAYAPHHAGLPQSDLGTGTGTGTGGQQPLVGSIWSGNDLEAARPGSHHPRKRYRLKITYLHPRGPTTGGRLFSSWSSRELLVSWSFFGVMLVAAVILLVLAGVHSL